MKIIIVALEICKYLEGDIYNDQFTLFDNLSVLEKIAYIKDRIIHLCEKLKVIEPNAMWIFTSREYSITRCNSPLLTEQKAHFKHEMALLTTQYPQLTIISCNSSQKVFKNNLLKRKLGEVQDHYVPIYGLHKHQLNCTKIIKWNHISIK